MFIKHIKSIVFYAIITFIIVASVLSDSRAWAKTERDIRNTLGSPPQVSTKMDSFEIKDMKENKIKSTQMGEGNLMLILWNMDEDGRNKMFFDTLSKLVKDGKCNKFNIVPVNIGNRVEEVKGFFQDNNYNFACYFDVDKTTKWAFNKSSKVPIVYFVDSEGIIRFRQQVGTKPFNNNFEKKLMQYK